MIDLKQVRPSQNKYVDGELEDGRLVEFKLKFPLIFDKLIQQVVAMANSFGGLIIFGVDERPLSFVGVPDDNIRRIDNFKRTIERLSLGITYSINVEVVDGKKVVVCEIYKATTTAYFSRAETSPARQIEYRYDIGSDGESSLVANKMYYTKVYKYMTLDTFLASLYCKNWRFFEPSKWNDKFEQRFYCAKYNISAAKGNTPQLFATCVTRNKNSEAAWKVYSNGQGLGAHCLQLELDIVELRKQLKNSGYRFEEKLVVYRPENVIIDLHKKRKSYYKQYFGAFTLDAFLNLLSLKREAYTYEQELRFFIIPGNCASRNTYKKAQCKDVRINWKQVIIKVRVDKKCSPAELVSIQSACYSVGINPVIINGNPIIGNQTPPPGSKNVDFELFDIDDMPGTSRITIN